MNFPDYIKNIVPLIIDAENEVISFFRKMELKKGDFLFRQGEICNKIFFIEQGLACVFYYTEKGKEITTWLSDE